jgi:two-component system NtrC family sensor kinase
LSQTIGNLSAAPAVSSPALPGRAETGWELAAEGITLRIRWFGLCVGYVLVDFLGRKLVNRPLMNSILSLGAIYALLDTFWSLKGQVFLSRWPLIVSLMEAVFIGLLCHFDNGVESPFLVYYFLSLLVCAIRYSASITYSTFALHVFSYSTLLFFGQVKNSDDATTFFLVLLFLGWVTWASTALAGLMKSAWGRLTELNRELRINQALLEQLIGERTRELQQSQALLVQHEKQAAFGLLAAGIAHEVGNPLAAISSLVQMLNRRQPDDYTRQKLHLVDDQLRRIQGILRELVDFSRPATKERSMCDIHTIIDAALNIAKYYKRTKGKRIVTCFAPGLPKLRVVRDQVVQVLLNLVLNAMDATAEGGTIELATWLSNGWLHVSVRDTGHGISAEQVPHIYEPYFTTKPTGTGLGLFVCKNIMEQVLDGKITLAESTPLGSMFVVSLTCDMVRNHPDVQESRTESTEVVGRSMSETGGMGNVSREF